MDFIFVERVGGIGPPSTGWKPVIIATIRYSLENFQLSIDDLSNLHNRQS